MRKAANVNRTSQSQQYMAHSTIQIHHSQTGLASEFTLAYDIKLHDQNSPIFKTYKLCT